MPQFIRIGAAAVLVGCVAWAAHAVDTPANLAEQKARVVRSLLENEPRAGAQESPPASLDEMQALLDVLPGAKAQDPALLLRTTGNPDCRTFTTDNGRRLIIDFEDTINVKPGRSYVPLAASGIRAVRTSLYSRPNTFVSRVVLDLAQASTLRIDSDPGLLRVLLRPERGGPECEVRVAMNCAEALEQPRDTGEAAQRYGQLAEQLAALQRRDAEPGQESGNHIAFAIVAIEEQDDPRIDAFAAAMSALLIQPEGAAADPLAARIAELAGGLEAVAVAQVDLGLADQAQDAAVDEEAAENAEEAPAETGPAPEAPPTPPGARQTPPPNTQEANTSIYSRMKNIVKGAQEGRDPFAEQGLTNAQGGTARARTPVRPIAPTSPMPMARRQVAPVPQPLPQVASEAPKPAAYKGDPLMQPVNIDFREMDLDNVVALLAHKAGINVIAGTDLSGTVTANLTNVPLRQAMETALRMNGLGMLEEEGIYHIVPYNQAVSAERTTTMVDLEQANSDEIQKVLEDIIKKDLKADLISISANKSANLVIISGPEDKVAQLEAMALQMDVAEPVTPTVTKAIKLNYAEPDQDVLAMVTGMLTPELGTASPDLRSRHLIVTDVPIVVEQVSKLIEELDTPAKQVIIDSMVVDAVLNDQADTGVDWLLSSVRRQSTRDAILDPGGRAIGNLQELSLGSNLSSGATAGLLNYALLGSDIDWRGVIQAEVRNRNGHLVSNPVLVTVENQEAKITIARDIPYTELTETAAGGSQTSTQFKEVGTLLTVTPRVTHDNDIIVEIMGKESGTQGEFNGVPIENRREVESVLRMKNGQTIFIGGLRKNDSDTTVRKVPLLGDIPVMNFLFRTNTRSKEINELLIFMTCQVLEDEIPQLTPEQQNRYDEGKNAPRTINLESEIIHDTVHPEQFRDPAWKWRRAE